MTEEEARRTAASLSQRGFSIANPNKSATDSLWMIVQKAEAVNTGDAELGWQIWLSAVVV